MGGGVSERHVWNEISIGGKKYQKFLTQQPLPSRTIFPKEIITYTAAPDKVTYQVCLSGTCIDSKELYRVLCTSQAVTKCNLKAENHFLVCLVQRFQFGFGSSGSIKRQVKQNFKEWFSSVLNSNRSQKQIVTISALSNVLKLISPHSKTTISQNRAWLRLFFVRNRSCSLDFDKAIFSNVAFS